MRRLSRRSTLVLGWAVVLGLLAAVVFWVGPGELLAPWLAIDPVALAVAVVLMLASYVLRTLRITRYFRVLLAGHFWATFRLSSWHNLMNNLLPMRSGEVAFPVLMRSYFGLSPLRSVPVLFWFRLLDLQVVVVIALLAGGAMVGLTVPWIAFLVVLLLAPLGVYLLRAPLHRRVAKGDGRLRGRLIEVLEALPDRPRLFVGTLVWTWANWAVKLCALGWVLAALAPVGFVEGVLGAIGGDLTTVLPVHAPGGFGTYEAGVALALGPFVDSGRELLAAGVNLHLFVLGSALIAAALTLLIPRPRPESR
ncbi:MAG: lysylphosphatidylglycerol synthase domain-containing protein [Guyparkeria sp.]